MLVIKAFSNSENTKFGLPGADTKSWWNNLGIKGLLKLMKDIGERDAEFVSVIGGYFGGKKYVFTEERIKGIISKEELTDSTVIEDFPYTNPHFFHSIFIPENAAKTYAQMKREEFMKFDYRRKNVEKFIKELQDFYHQENLQPSFDFS